MPNRKLQANLTKINVLTDEAVHWQSPSSLKPIDLLKHLSPPLSPCNETPDVSLKHLTGQTSFHRPSIAEILIILNATVLESIEIVSFATALSSLELYCCTVVVKGSVIRWLECCVDESGALSHLHLETFIS
jgi:hypothetical protein